MVMVHPAWLDCVSVVYEHPRRGQALVADLRRCCLSCGISADPNTAHNTTRALRLSESSVGFSAIDEAYDRQIERVTLPNGKLGVVFSYGDFTAQKQAEAALRESEEQFRNIATQMIGLLLLELATNAVKHGAWSAGGGRVTVSWEFVTNGAAENSLRVSPFYSVRPDGAVHLWR